MAATLLLIITILVTSSSCEDTEAVDPDSELSEATSSSVGSSSTETSESSTSTISYSVSKRTKSTTSPSDKDDAANLESPMSTVGSDNNGSLESTSPVGETSKVPETQEGSSTISVDHITVSAMEFDASCEWECDEDGNNCGTECMIGGKVVDK